MSLRNLVAKSKLSPDQDVELQADEAARLLVTDSVVSELLGMSGGVNFNYLQITSTGADQDTLRYRLGGVSGTVKKTLVINYASGAEKISDSLSSLAYS